jgi:hypothetical protein
VLSASVLLNPLSFCISASNATLACFDATVESFEQQYQTLNTATNALMANYTEQKRVADLEIAWQNQLTVVTRSLTTANNARANAITDINGNDSMHSKLASIEASKQANASLLSEIRKNYLRPFF